MIVLTRLNGQNFVVNAEKIRMVESTPDTVVCCESGERMMVMVLEAVVLFAGFKFLGGGPKPASAVELSKEEGGGGKEEGGKGEGKGGAGKPANDKDRLVELTVVDFKAPNTQNGRRYIYDV